MDLDRSMTIAASGMRAQATRLRIIAENLANRDSTAERPGGEPYRRRVVTFAERLDRATDTRTVRVSRIGTDRSEFERRYDPGHPAADARGYVLLPNVNSVIESMDMMEAQRSYSANLGVLSTSREMLMRTIESLG
jgi:flagellar basal-body rod protein FlgC